MKKPTVHLFDNVGFGIIILYPTGILVSNQTGGTACLHPEIEGIFVPLRNDYDVNNKFISPEIELAKHFEGEKHGGAGATNGLDEEDVQFIESILETFRLDEIISLDRGKLKESHESWVFVDILCNESELCPAFHGFKPYPRKGVLTWANSD